MPDLLLELFSEEIPARMQGPAASALERAVNKALIDAGFLPEGVKGFAGPRRLTVITTGLPARQPDRKEEKKGPRVGAPEKAVEGFLKSAGLSSLDECETRSDKKGEYYVAIIEQKGRDTAELIGEVMLVIITGFSWPKSMRWGEHEMRWVRPLHRILCVFNGEVVSFSAGDLTSSDQTEGHRFMAPGAIQTRSFEDYEQKLRSAKVILDADERREMIAADAATLCQSQGLELVEDAGLLGEVSGLSEWPIAMMGRFDEKFLKLPDEVLTASMRGHQKYFSVRNPKTGRLANKFICVANIEAPDGGAAMRQGYERVLTARLSDGWYLHNQDLKVSLEDRIADLDRVTFFEGLGSVGDKARRVAALAREIAPAIGADPVLAKRAALLAKADLVSQMVYEFPELQGVMGRYYALEQGEPAEVADAIRDHYKPAGQDDDVPTAPVSVAVALADKIDTLTAFWAIDKKPTGSSDPFALRRAALGVINIILANNVRLSVLGVSLLARPYFLSASLKRIMTESLQKFPLEEFKSVSGTITDFVAADNDARIQDEMTEKGVYAIHDAATFADCIKKALTDESFSSANPHWLFAACELKKELSDLVVFFHDRLKVYLKDKNHRYDHIDAVLADSGGNLQDDVVLIVAKLNALEAFLKNDDGTNLVAAYKRAANILKSEEKKGALPDAMSVDPKALDAPEEKAVFNALEAAEAKAKKAVASEDFEAAMSALSMLRAPLDAFFEAVTVNADDAKLRANRLALLQRFITATANVADFSKLEG